MIEIPRWRFEPELVWLRCKTIKPLPQLHEFVVQFDADGAEFTSFVPERFVNLENNGLGACIIADVNGGVLVDIPADTFTSGPRIMVRDEERNSVLIPFSRSDYGT